MRKTLAVTAATTALLLGGVLPASAETVAAPNATVQAVDNDADSNDGDKTGLWGLLGLLGLAGLAKRRVNDDANRDVNR